MSRTVAVHLPSPSAVTIVSREEPLRWRRFLVGSGAERGGLLFGAGEVGVGTTRTGFFRRRFRRVACHCW